MKVIETACQGRSNAAQIQDGKICVQSAERLLWAGGVLGAVLHNIGQITAAVRITKSAGLIHNKQSLSPA